MVRVDVYIYITTCINSLSGNLGVVSLCSCLDNHKIIGMSLVSI